jgi:hypothetical protein
MLHIKKEIGSKTFLLLALLAIILIVSAMIIPVGGDFKNSFRPSGQAILEGKSPYNITGYYSPPWLAVIFIPFALLPERLSWILFYSLNFIIYTVSLTRLGINKWQLIMIMGSSSVFYSLWYGNIDSLVILGATLPPFWGIWFLLCKPQMSIGLIGMLLLRSFRVSYKQGLKDFGLVSLVCLLVYVFKLYPLNMPVQTTWNFQTFPWGIIPGILIFCLAAQKLDCKLALSSSPFFSPYVGMQSWVVTLLPTSKYNILCFLGYALGWVFVLLRMTIKAAPFNIELVLLMLWGLLIFGFQYKKIPDFLLNFHNLHTSTNE